MGIMPVDRELKWQRLFRRFGLPGENQELDSSKRSGDRKDKPQTADAKKYGKPSTEKIDR